MPACQIGRRVKRIFRVAVTGTPGQFCLCDRIAIPAARAGVQRKPEYIADRPRDLERLVESPVRETPPVQRDRQDQVRSIQ